MYKVVLYSWITFSNLRLSVLKVHTVSVMKKITRLIFNYDTNFMSAVAEPVFAGTTE